VADDMVYRNAAAMCIAAIAQGCRNPATAHRHFAHDIVELLRFDTRHDMRHQRVQYLGGEPSGAPHAFEAFSPVQFDNPIAGNSCLGGRDAYILIHAGNIEGYSPLCEGVIYAIAPE
jgi:hypothetical protein